MLMQKLNICCINVLVCLINGTSPYDGRVEVYYTGVLWGTVCNNNWGIMDADVVCHQLGFSDTSRTYTHGLSGHRRRKRGGHGPPNIGYL